MRHEFTVSITTASHATFAERALLIRLSGDYDITGPRTLYKFAELSESAQANALQVVAGKLGGEWWGDSDNERVSEDMTYALGQALGVPGIEEWGEGDFPGIPGLSPIEWETTSSGYVTYLTVTGTLTPETAPSLDWEGLTEPAASFDVGERTVESVEGSHGGEDDDPALFRSWDDALAEAVKAGQAAIEYMGNEDNAREFIEDNDTEFTEKGELA